MAAFRGRPAAVFGVRDRATLRGDRTGRRGCRGAGAYLSCGQRPDAGDGGEGDGHQRDERRDLAGPDRRDRDARAWEAREIAGAEQPSRIERLGG